MKPSFGALPFRLSRQAAPLISTVLVWALLYAAGGVRYNNFLSTEVFLNFLSDKAFLGVTAVGMTFVILSGGIDLSVGAVIGFTGIFISTLVAGRGVHPVVAIGLALALGTAMGAAMGAIITFFALPPFLVTLAGMFFARGLALVVSTESVSIRHPFYDALSDFGASVFSVPALLFLLTLVGGIITAHFTRFGRAVYALGGNEQSAVLMGLPVRSTKVGVYALSGFCAALGGVAATIYLRSGDATRGTMLELDAIAAVVIGGTLLTGGVGYVIGTLFGVLILGTIETAINFEGTLGPAWIRIAIGFLLLLFILLQKIIAGRAAGRREGGPASGKI